MPATRPPQDNRREAVEDNGGPPLSKRPRTEDRREADSNIHSTEADDSSEEGELYFVNNKCSLVSNIFPSE